MKGNRTSKSLSDPKPQSMMSKVRHIDRQEFEKLKERNSITMTLNYSLPSSHSILMSMNSQHNFASVFVPPTAWGEQAVELIVK